MKHYTRPNPVPYHFYYYDGIFSSITLLHLLPSIYICYSYAENLVSQYFFYRKCKFWNNSYKIVDAYGSVGIYWSDEREAFFPGKISMYHQGDIFSRHSLSYFYAWSNINMKQTGIFSFLIHVIVASGVGKTLQNKIHVAFGVIVVCNFDEVIY